MNNRLLLREQTIQEWKGQIHLQDAHASSRVMRTYHTHFGKHIGRQPGRWDDQKCATKPTLPSYLRHTFPNHLLRALSRLSLRLSTRETTCSHNLNVERLRQQQHRVPYELRICTKCNWLCVQDEEHVLLNCASADLANSCIKDRQLFRSPSRNSNRLRDFTSQADIKGLALYVHECLECCA